ncbi:MAG: hypothetical protein GOVbin556_19 [Prokaryotic dsDNA virus sp.]|nr:MAG: hypothetical protein GOVbin556_19 [Prokaryotic dsDNA virus sp.]|tara:strand:- start:1228 stop:1455 length:228 start_codon:yes stop_codon:yes gene_type:complete
MKLEAYGETIVCREAKTKTGHFVMTENNKAEVISVGDKVENLNVGEFIFYEPNKKEIIGEFFVIHFQSVLCKVME